MVNWLIGQGESLVQKIDLSTGGGAKAYPYSFEEAFSRLDDQLEFTADAVESLPNLACPNDEAVVALTLNPAFLAKTYHPTNLLAAHGLRQVGSRQSRIVPDKVTAKSREGDEMVAPELFVAGPRNRLVRFMRGVRGWSSQKVLAEDFRKIEQIRPLGLERLKQIEPLFEQVPIEVVLHAEVETLWGDSVISAFVKWCNTFGVDVNLERRQQVGGLSFLGVRANSEVLPELVKFAFTRVVRRMPRLSLREVALRASPVSAKFDLTELNREPLSNEVKVAIFDGGLAEDHPFGSLVNRLDAPNLGDSLPNCLEHGCQVTSALLYGPLSEAQESSRPFSKIDHWRVIDDEGDDFELMSTLDRIANVLNQRQYQFANLSLGPDEAILDDEVHVWTARLDQIAASGQILIVCAAGNNGHLDEPSGLCRVQPSGDGVNVLSVGASDTLGADWKRAPYSAKGPGRTPGFVKPDIVAFGGTDTEPFMALSADGEVNGTTGTSFSTPSVTRLASGVSVLFGSQLTTTAIKALMVHNADPSGHSQIDVGWGQVPSELQSLAVCADDEATVIYQGTLEPARFMRFPLPIPVNGFSKTVKMRATFVFASHVDPEDSISYTRTGLGITFRPSTIGHPGYHPDGKERSTHPSKTFFGKNTVFKTEQELRGDALRWETVLRAEKRFQPATLQNPVFDVEHLTRAHGHNAQRPTTIPYALIVTIYEAGNRSLYNEIIRSYGGRLTAMIPQIEVDIRTRG